VNDYITSLSEVLKALIRKNVRVLICLAPFMQRSRFIQNLRRKYTENQNIFIRFCKRIHLKSIIVDLEFAYIGTANLSGAGVGIKSIRKRNFELGIITDDPDIIADIAYTYMEIFNGKFCSKEKCHFFKNYKAREPCEGILSKSI
jgi:phosphatidylserine/phosphatidylglycerophosphate/cardiolipin synthase-like enzyme